MKYFEFYAQIKKKLSKEKIYENDSVKNIWNKKKERRKNK